MPNLDSFRRVSQTDLLISLLDMSKERNYSPEVGWGGVGGGEGRGGASFLFLQDVFYQRMQSTMQYVQIYVTAGEGVLSSSSHYGQSSCLGCKKHAVSRLNVFFFSLNTTTTAPNSPCQVSNVDSKVER